MRHRNRILIVLAGLTLAGLAALATGQPNPHAPAITNPHAANDPHAGMRMRPPQAPVPPADPATLAALERARDAARTLSTGLKARLEAELAAGGPARAMRVCADEAQALIAAHQAEGLPIRRVSERVRNPADRPDEWESAGLAHLAALAAKGEPLGEISATQVGEEEEELRYLTPLVIAAPCLSCHGDPATFAPEVKALLAERYPQDRAVGYREGELRGAVSVRVRLSVEAEEP